MRGLTQRERELMKGESPRLSQRLHNFLEMDMGDWRFWLPIGLTFALGVFLWLRSEQPQAPAPVREVRAARARDPWEITTNSHWSYQTIEVGDDQKVGNLRLYTELTITTPFSTNTYRVNQLAEVLNMLAYNQWKPEWISLDGKKAIIKRQISDGSYYDLHTVLTNVQTGQVR